ncbi:MAG: conjugal transfer protein TraF [Elusimicrobia bacterium]|nr:conjugal transfer protein TraF [Elusimicrobiota bacterium]
MKHIRIRRIAWSALAAMIIARPALAAYEDVGVGARVSGLGHAYTAVADDVYSMYYNPAGLATLDRPEFGTTYSRLLTGLSDGSNVQNSFLGYAHPIDGGRRGTAGAAWNNFGVGGLYSENQLMFSYGHSLFARTVPDRYYLGGTLKYMNRSIGGTSAAANGISNTGVATGTPDPGLQNTSKMNIDADLGFLWRIRPRWTAGVMIQHLMEPNIGFSESDKLGRNIKLGGAYKTPFSTLTGDVRFQSAPDGSTDKILAVAAEKWLPTLLHGMFGVRGSLSMGSRDFRQVAIGLSYKINRMQFDYGFALPIGGLNSTSGSHRLGLTMRFGRPKQAEAAFGEAILENLRDLAAVGTPEFRYQMEDLALYKRTAIDEFLRQAKLDASAGRFSDAADKLTQAISLKPKDPRLQQSLERMVAVADIYPAVKDYQTDAAQAAVYEGALDFISGNGKESLRKLAYAGTLNPTDERIERLAKAVEAKSGLTREGPPPEDSGKAPTMGAEKVVGGTMALMEVALRERDFERVVKLADQVLQIDPSNALAYKRLGAAHYALHHNSEALKALRSAYKLETDSDSRKQIKSYIDALQSLIERGRRDSAPAKTAEPVKSSGLSPVDIERLYEQGVDLYAQGKLTESAAAFRRILESEPNNTSARRALDRVQSEIITGGQKK